MDELYMNFNRKDYNIASNQKDMLLGCINRIFVADSDEECDRMFICAISHISDIYKYGLRRRAFENSKNIKGD